jgi:putative component of membrane protein insertase Oxa1/YidC/SpoIIIJ protein YidD
MNGPTRVSTPRQILLSTIHIFQCLRKSGILAKLHFHKNQMSTVSNDQIQLAKPAAIVGSHQLVALFRQVFRCDPFTPGTCDVISSHCTF